MFENLIAKKIFKKLFSRPDISKAYALTDESDSWYPTLKKVHDSLSKVVKKEHFTANIKSSDGLKLTAVVYPNEKGAKDAPTVICVHGYTSHAEREWAFPALYYLSLGYNVMIPYQRAHGLSEGKYITFGGRERQDMLRWVEKAVELFPETKIVVHGLSMGGGIALQLCSSSDKNIKCIVADAPSFGVDGIFDYASKQCGKKRADKVYAALLRIFEEETGRSAEDMRIEGYVKNSNYPIYLTVGELEDSVEALGKLKSDTAPVKFVVLSGCSHGNGMYKQTETYHRELGAFLSEYVN